MTRDTCEQIQEDLLTFLDGMESSMTPIAYASALDGVCQIVVNNFKKDEPQHVKYIDELLWLLKDARRVAYGEAGLSVLAEVINEMSDGIPEWLESLKKGKEA